MPEFCPDCTTPLKNKHSCPCGWKTRVAIEGQKTCPKCQMKIPIWYHYHTCGWKNRWERLITDCTRIGSEEALKKFRAAKTAKELLDYECST